ncbi:hypothetical protein B0H14DRAFT_2866396 [Mycena olivaceomarginata]|nr:hypothetical protein B0H14DRAFT_2866396 [Mycena olivaceomarginata]
MAIMRPSTGFPGWVWVCLGLCASTTSSAFLCVCIDGQRASCGDVGFLRAPRARAPPSFHAPSLPLHSVSVPVFSPSLTHLTIRRPSNFTSKIWLVWLSRTTRIAPLPPPALAPAAPPLPAPHSAPRSHTRTLRS